MGEEITLNQQEVKELLGEVYDEDKHYDVRLTALDDTFPSKPALQIKVEGFDYKVEPGLITTVVKLDVDSSDFIESNDFTEGLNAYNRIYKQTYDRLKSLSMYDTLVNKYGLTKSDYIKQNYEAIENYINDNSDDELKLYVYVTLQEEFRLTEDHIERLSQEGRANLFSKSYKILNIDEHITPKMISELGLSDLLVSEEGAELQVYFDNNARGWGSTYAEVTMSCE